MLRCYVERARPVFVWVECDDSLDFVVARFQGEGAGDVEDAEDAAVAGGDAERAKAGEVDGNWAIGRFDGALASDERLSGGQEYEVETATYHDSPLR